MRILSDLFGARWLVLGTLVVGMSAGVLTAGGLKSYFDYRRAQWEIIPEAACPECPSCEECPSVPECRPVLIYKDHTSQTTNPEKCPEGTVLEMRENVRVSWTGSFGGDKYLDYMVAICQCPSEEDMY